MPVRVIKVSGCDDGTCPAVYISDAGTVVVQGALLSDVEGMTLGRVSEWSRCRPMSC
jgi:hypothetical protein